MIRLSMQGVTFLLTVAGIIICAMGSEKNKLYRGGLYFFIFSLLSGIYSFIRLIAITPYIIYMQRGGISAEIINRRLQLFEMPGFILYAIGLVVFIVFLVKGLNENRDSSLNEEYPRS